MRIVISNQDRISGGTDTDFKVQLNLPVDISRKYYKCYIEKVMIALPITNDETNVLSIDVYSESMIASSDTFSSGKPNLLTTVVQQKSDPLTQYYTQSKQNSIPDFETTNINSIQHFKLSFDEFTEPVYGTDDPVLLSTRGFFTNRGYDFPDGGILFKIILNFEEFVN